MSDRNFKEIRKQLRTVAREALPEVLQNELVTAAYEQLRKEMKFELEGIQSSVNAALTRMEERSKDVHGFILNSVQAELAKTAPKNPIVEDKTSDNLEPAQEQA